MKPIVVVVAVVALGAGAYAALDWTIGSKVEQGLARQYEPIQSLPLVKLSDRQYERRLRGADESLTLTIGCPNVKLPGKADANAGFEIKVRRRIEHGPITREGFTAAVIDTELIPPAQFNDALRKLFGEHRPLTIRTKVAFDGSSVTAMEVAPLHMQAADFKAAEGGSLQWQGLTNTAKLAADGKSLSYTLNLRPLTLTDPRGGIMQIGAMHIEGFGKQAFGWMFDDEQKGNIESVVLDFSAMRAAPGAEADALAEPTATKKPLQRIEFKNIAVASRHKIDNDYLSQTQSFEATEFMFGGRPIGKLHYGTTLDKIHMPSIVNLLKSIAGHDKGIDCAMFADGRGAEMIGPILDKAKAGLLELTRHSPSFSVDRFGISNANGEARVGYRFDIAPLEESDFQSKDELVRKFKVKLEAAVDQPLIVDLATMGLTGAGQGDPPSAADVEQMLSQAVEPMIKQGLLQQDGKRLHLISEWSDGELKVNGRALDLSEAMGMMRAPPAEPSAEPPVEPKARPAPRKRASRAK